MRVDETTPSIHSLFGAGFVPSVLYDWPARAHQRFRAATPGVELGRPKLITVQRAGAPKPGRIDAGFARLQLDEPAIGSEVLMEELVGHCFQPVTGSAPASE
jgi:hypothetical protein